MIGRRTPGSERGYVLMIVLVLILVMSTAAVYGVRAMDSEVRASASTRKNEMAMHAAEAGASERLAEIALATDTKTRAISRHERRLALSHASRVEPMTASSAMNSSASSAPTS